MLISVFLIAASLAMDAFAISVSGGILFKRMKLSQALVFGYYFGVAQAAMTFIGCALGSLLSTWLVSVGNLCAFVILAIIGGKMLWETFHKNESGDDFNGSGEKISHKKMFVMSVATSIDALAVGAGVIGLEPRYSAHIVFCGITIGAVTFVLTVIGALLGKKLGGAIKTYAERVGGAVLILIGLKILFFS